MGDSSSAGGDNLTDLHPLDHYHEDIQIAIVLEIFNTIFVIVLCLPPLLTVMTIRALHTPDNVILMATLISGLLAGVWHLPMTVIAGIRDSSHLIKDKQAPCMLLHVSKMFSEKPYYSMVFLMSIHNCIVVFNFLWYEQNFTNKVAVFTIACVLSFPLTEICVFISFMDFDEHEKDLDRKCSYNYNFNERLRRYDCVMSLLELVSMFTLNLFLFFFTCVKNHRVRMGEHMNTAFILRYDLIRDTSIAHLFFCGFWIPTVGVKISEEMLQHEASNVVWNIARLLRHMSMFYYPTAYCFRRELLNRGFALVITTPCWKWKWKLRNLSAVTLQENLEFNVRRQGIDMTLLSEKEFTASSEGQSSQATGSSLYYRKYGFDSIIKNILDGDEEGTIQDYLEPAPVNKFGSIEMSSQASGDKNKTTTTSSHLSSSIR